MKFVKRYHPKVIYDCGSHRALDGLDLLKNLQAKDINMILIYLLLGLLTVITIVPIWYELRRKKFNLLDPKTLFIIYYSGQFIIYTVYLIVSDKPFVPWLSIYSDENIPYYIKALLLANVGLLFFYIGYYSKIGHIFKKCLPRVSSWISVNANLVGFIYIFIGIVGFKMFLNKHGGIIEFFYKLGSWRSIGLVGEGIYTFPVSTVLTLGALILLVDSFIKKIGTIKKMIIYLLVLLSFIPVFSFGFRISFGMILFQFAICWHYLKSPISLKKGIIILTITVLFMTGYGIIRQVVEIFGIEGIIKVPIFIESDLYSSMLSPVILRTHATEVVVETLKAIDSGKSSFKSIHHSVIESITIFVPRAIWKDKPEGQMAVFGLEVMGDFLRWRSGGILPEATGGTSPTPVGFFYWYLGSLGVILGMFLIGLLFNISYRYLMMNKSNPSRVIIYSTIGSTLIIAAESPQDSFNNLVPKLMLVIVSLFLIGIRVK
ncbi:MAG: O-antigen polymerase [Candidatus Micrarchaeia archaeon]